MRTQLSALMNNRLHRTLAIVAGASILAAAGYEVLANRPVEVRVARLERNVLVRVFGLGTVEARVLSKIGFEVGAAIVELGADHGDLVKKGDVLARLDTAAQKAKTARAEAAVISAEASVKKALANVEKARAILAQRREANKRKQALVGRAVVSEETAEEAQRDEDVAGAELAVAMSDVDVAKAQLVDAKASHAFEKTILEQHMLLAPFDAMVVERHKEAGTVVKAGDPIFTLVAPESVWGLAYVDEARAGAIEIGQRAEVRLRSLPQEILPAKVARIGVESDRVNEERRVYVKCEACPPRFHLGEQAEVMITVAALDAALLVPETAVAGFDGVMGTVWTVEGGQFARRAVRFGHRTEDARLEIVSGLPEGARVLVEPGPGLREGRRAAAVEQAR